MRGEPTAGEHVRACAEAWRHIPALDPSPPRGCRPRKDARAMRGPDAAGGSGLVQELVAPALPPDRRLPQVGWLTRPAVRRPPGDQQDGAADVHAHRPRRFLGRLREAPRLRVLLETARLEQPAPLIVVEGLPGGGPPRHWAGRPWCLLVHHHLLGEDPLVQARGPPGWGGLA
jgi:hypothetical protein